MNKKSVFWGLLFSTFMSVLLFFMGLSFERLANSPRELYQVYIDLDSKELKKMMKIKS